MTRPSLARLCAYGLATVGICALPLATAAAQSPTTAWDSIATILQTPTAPTGGYQRYNFPRRDITLRVRDVTVAPALALGGWLGFAGSPAAPASNPLLRSKSIRRGTSFSGGSALSPSGAPPGSADK